MTKKPADSYSAKETGISGDLKKIRGGLNTFARVFRRLQNVWAGLLA
jgi:hypothetical protein